MPKPKKPLTDLPAKDVMRALFPKQAVDQLDDFIAGNDQPTRAQVVKSEKKSHGPLSGTQPS